VPRSVSLRQVKEVGTSSPDDGDVLIFVASSGKYEPGPQSDVLDDILVDDNTGAFLTDNNSGNPVLKG